MCRMREGAEGTVSLNGASAMNRSEVEAATHDERVSSRTSVKARG